jgi:hypothetical protein
MLSKSREGAGQQVSQDPLTEEPLNPVAKMDSPLKGELINNRYRIIRRLGHGGMGAVYLALDAREDRLLALKRVRKDRLDPRTLAILRNEFLAMAALPHPNLARVFDFEVDRVTADLFFTSEFVDGQSWLEVSRELNLKKPQGLEVFLDLVAQVLRALEFIHSRDMVHGDVKPENILVTVESQDEEGSHSACRIKVIDFGLAKRERAFGGEKILGTPYYVAPETILGSLIDRRTDLYSLGVVLYHLTTGELPFRGDSNLVILKSHVERSPAPPQQVAPWIPAELGEIILRLMKKSPNDRFHGALAVLEQINRAFGLKIPLETAATIGGYLEAGALAGREKELKRMQAVLLSSFGTAAAPPETTDDIRLRSQSEKTAQAHVEGEAQAPAGRMMILRGEKGLGKRRMARELRYLAQIEGAALLEVECAGGEGRGSSFERLVDELLFFEGTADEPDAPPYIEQATLLAEATRTGSGAQLEEGPRALEEVALGILESSQKQPLLLHFHDLHLADSTLLELVMCLVRLEVAGKAPGNRLLMTATALDPGDVEGSDFQRLCDGNGLYRHFLELKLGRLDEAGVGQLVRSVFKNGEFQDAFLGRVIEESDGNPKIVIEILSFLARRKKITRTGSGWVLEKDYEREDIPGKVRTELKSRISKLPPEALRLAMAFACMEEDCPLELASHLAGSPPRSNLRNLLLLRREKILQVTENNVPEVYSFIHRSARAMLYEMIPASEMASLHERAGALWEEHYSKSGKVNVKNLAHHYFRAQSREKGIRFGLEAARELGRGFQPLEAIAAYEQVLSLSDEKDEELRSKMHREIAALRFEMGDYRSALELLEPLCKPGEAQKQAGARASACLDAARAQARLGHFESGEKLLKEALQVEERQRPSASTGAISLAHAELCFYQGKLVESLRHCTRALERQGEIKDPALLGQLYMLTAENHFLLSDRESAASYSQLALRVLDSQHDPQLLASNLFCRGKYYTYQQQFTKAVKQLQLSLLLKKKTNARDGQADCLLEIGTIQNLLGRPEDAKPQIEEALALYEKNENLPQSVVALCRLADVFRLLGEYDKCQQLIRQALQWAEPLERKRVLAETLHTLAGFCVDRGDLVNAERYLQKARANESKGAGTSHMAAHALALISERALHAGDLSAALDYSAKGILAARQNGDQRALLQLLIRQSLMFCRLGKSIEARRTLVTLFDSGKRHGLPVIEGWARLIEALVLADEEKASNAEKSFAQAAELLAEHGSERDLVHLNLEQGIWRLKTGQHEPAYLNLEDGLHRAKKLQLAYEECRYHLAMGKLETALQVVPTAEAERNFRRAEELAMGTGYTELLWQVHLQLGKLFLKDHRDAEAESALAESFSGLQNVQKRIPASYRQSYLRRTPPEDLEILLEHAARRGSGEAESQPEKAVAL